VTRKSARWRVSTSCEPRRDGARSWPWFDVRVGAEHVGLTAAHDPDSPYFPLTAECFATRRCGDKPGYNEQMRVERGGPEPYDGFAELWFDESEFQSSSFDRVDVRNAVEILITDEREFIGLSQSPLFMASNTWRARRRDALYRYHRRRESADHGAQCRPGCALYARACSDRAVCESAR
jgi:hypothetical protein